MSWGARLKGWLSPSNEGAVAVPLRPGAAIVEDRQLAEWVRPQPEPLLPVLRQASFMRPLVLLLAVLPPLIAFEYRPLSLAGAEWSLRALDSYAAGTVAGFLDPVADPQQLESHGRPAGICWLTALGMGVTGPARNGSRSVMTLACVMGLVLCCHLLASRFRGDRLGLIAAGLVACQSTVLGFAQQPEPDGLTLLCLTAALWSWQKHLIGTHRRLTGWLLLASLALAGVFLTGGGLGGIALLVMLSVLVLHVRATPDSGRGLWDGVLLTGLSLPLGLWWIAWIVFRHGPSTVTTWLTNGPAPPELVILAPADAAVALLRSTGPWMSLAVAGLWSAFGSRIVTSPPEGEQRLGGTTLLVLAGITIGAWSLLTLLVPVQIGVGRPWTSAASLAVWLLAAVGILAIAERRLSFPASLSVLVFSLGEFAGHWLDSTQLNVNPTGVWLLVAGATICVVCLARMVGPSEVKRRALLLGLLVFCGAGGAWLSAAGLQRATPEDRQLQTIRLSYINLPQARSCCLIIGETARGTAHDAMRRRYLIRSIWPHLPIQESNDSQPPRVPDTAPTEAEGADIVILWGTRQHIPGGDFVLASSHDDRGYEVATYVRRSANPIPDEPRADF